MEIGVHYVKTHISGAHNAHNRIEISSVIVEETTRIVHGFGNNLYILFEFAEVLGFVSIKPATVSSQTDSEPQDRTPPFFSRRDIDNGHSCESGACGVCPVCRIGYYLSCYGGRPRYCRDIFLSLYNPVSLS
jgi:hypothetical protein